MELHDNKRASTVKLKTTSQGKKYVYYFKRKNQNTVQFQYRRIYKHPEHEQQGGHLIKHDEELTDQAKKEIKQHYNLDS